MMFWMFPREAGEQIKGWESQGLMPVNTVKWSVWSVEFRGKRRVGAKRRPSPGLSTFLAFLVVEVFAGCSSQLACVLFNLEDLACPSTNVWDRWTSGRAREISPAAHGTISLDWTLAMANTHI